MTASDILATGKEGLIKPPLLPSLGRESPSGAVTSSPPVGQERWIR